MGAIIKILITVGTTPFDRLIKAVDVQLSDLFELTSQISEGQFEPINHAFFRFSPKIDEYIENADLIVSHGGAGTIYQVLELGKKLVIVPNLDRVDHHQLDICDYMTENNHALACVDLNTLADTVNEAIQIDFIPYVPEPFTGIPEIRSYLGLK